MIDFSQQDIHFRGYPLTAISEGCWDALAKVDLTAAVMTIVRATLPRMEDTAGPGEPSGWLFEARLPAGARVWLQRGGGMRDERGHHGGYWTMMLPEEM